MNNQSGDKQSDEKNIQNEAVPFSRSILDKNPIIVHIGTQINIFSSKSMNSQQSSNIFNPKQIPKQFNTNKSNE